MQDRFKFRVFDKTYNEMTYNQMQDVCGDGWTVDVIAHILKGLKEN